MDSDCPRIAWATHHALVHRHCRSIPRVQCKSPPWTLSAQRTPEAAKRARPLAENRTLWRGFERCHASQCCPSPLHRSPNSLSALAFTRWSRRRGWHLGPAGRITLEGFAARCILALALCSRGIWSTQAWLPTWSNSMTHFGLSLARLPLPCTSQASGKWVLWTDLKSDWLRNCHHCHPAIEESRSC